MSMELVKIEIINNNLHKSQYTVHVFRCMICTSIYEGARMYKAIARHPPLTIGDAPLTIGDARTCFEFTQFSQPGAYFLSLVKILCLIELQADPTSGHSHSAVRTSYS